jgi:DNA-binding transcriptional ArsR family regulator
MTGAVHSELTHPSGRDAAPAASNGRDAVPAASNGRDAVPAASNGRDAAPAAAAPPSVTVRFTESDLIRVRFSAAPAPLVEAARGFAELRYQLTGKVVSNWATQALTVFPVTARPLLDLIPASGLWPDFLDPAVADLDEGLEIVASTPRSLLRSELAWSWHRAGRPPTWLQALADGDREARAIMIGALRDFYLACVAPSWPAIVASFHNEIAIGAGVLAQSGLEGLFGTLHPDLTWQAGSLQRATPTRIRMAGPADFQLDGQGLHIMPSALWTGPPLFSICPPSGAANILTYPARPAAKAQGIDQSRDLAPLIGRTRAAALQALRQPCSTAELAARLGISAPSASEHATALRGAALIQTERRGRGVRHSLTPLGRSLLIDDPAQATAEDR